MSNRIFQRKQSIQTKKHEKKTHETIRCSRDTMNIVGCMLINEDIEGIHVVVGFAVKNIRFYIHDLL